MYYAFNRKMKNLFDKDKKAHDFMCKANYTTNYTEEIYEGLEQFEFPFSFQIYIDDLGISRKQLEGLVQKLIEIGYVDWAYKSKSRHTKSRMENILAQEIFDTKNGDGKRDGNGDGKTVENTGFTGNVEMVNEMVKEISSINKSKNKSNSIYLNLKFIDESIDKVKLTKEQYEKLISEFGEFVVHKKILDMDSYVSQKKPYKDYNKALRTWIRKDNDKNENIPSKSKATISNFEY